MESDQHRVAGDDGAGVITAREVARAQLMANIADSVSLEALVAFLEGPHPTILDVGAGDSTTLGRQIRERCPEAAYVPVDRRPEAMAQHARAGFDAQVGDATALPFADRSVDFVHARFLFGWLDKERRRRALEELLRVGKGDFGFAIIDYDWAAATGPEPIRSLIQQIKPLMRGLGFDPDYGAYMHEEIQAMIADYRGRDLVATRVGVTPLRLPCKDALPILEATADVLVERLAAIPGLEGIVGNLQSSRAAVSALARSSPQAQVVFPSVVSVSGGAHRAEAGPADVKRIRTASLPVGPASLEATRLVSPELIQQARILHAEAFRRHGNVTEAALNSDGTLIDEIDPPDLIGSSIYLGTQSAEGHLTGCIRLIGPGDGVEHLPTIKKLRSVEGAARALSGLPFLQGAKVAEASALGRTDQDDSFTGTAKLILAAFCEVDRNGCDYVVMSIVDEVSALLETSFGPGVFRRIGDGATKLWMAGKGMSSGGVRLVPYYVDVHACLDQAMDYLRHQSDATSRAMLALCEDVQRFRRGR